jgi:integrase/recombinase XerD
MVSWKESTLFYIYFIINKIKWYAWEQYGLLVQLGVPAPNKSLILYKRHNASCHVHDLNLRSSVQRFWMLCECPIWITGRTPDGREVPRQATGQTDLKLAESVRSAILLEAKGDERLGLAISECTRKFLASIESEVRPKTLAQHGKLLERFTAYCHMRKVFHMSGLSADLCEDFKVEGLPGQQATTRRTSTAKLRVFLKAAFRRDWITQSLAEKVTPYHAEYEQKQPYTDKELADLLAACSRMRKGRKGYSGHLETFRLLLDLMDQTGMRISDAVRFDPAKLVKGKHLWIYPFVQQKRKRTETARTIEAFLEDKLVEDIRACTWLSPELPFSWGHFPPDYLPTQVYFRMVSLGKLCGVKDCRPHRLRDTFAVRKLSGGMSLEEVCRLLGHSSVAVTEKFYGAWSPTRREGLEARVASSLVNAGSDTLRH